MIPLSDMAEYDVGRNEWICKACKRRWSNDREEEAIRRLIEEHYEQNHDWMHSVLKAANE
jgi:hypothetical protein